MEPPPNYREAYPCLDIFELQAAFWRGELVCLFDNERGFRCGQVAILDTSEASVDIVYWLHRPPHAALHWEARVQLPIEPAPNAVHKDRFYWLCPNCAKRRKKLYFKAEWMCAECHGLHFWSQVVSPDVAEYERKEERYRELNALIGAGRRKGMRQYTYLALRKQLGEHRDWLKDADERRACAEHQYVVTGYWKRPEDVDELWTRNFMIRNGKIVPSPKF